MMDLFNHSNQRKYQVFLSFRGPDVRKSLADHLYLSLSTAGIHVFRDSEELEKGRNIGSNLREAIHNTDICIPIFSPNYAESRWCLDELSLMWESRKEVIPLFYNVDPSDVRHPDRGRYAEAFKKHYRHSSEGSIRAVIINGWKKALNKIDSLFGLSVERTLVQARYTTSTVNNWKDTLKDVADLSGFTLDATSGYEGELVKQVVLTVLQKLNNLPFDVAKYPVGLRQCTDKLINLLKVGLDSRVITVGIWGMGGLGKSTISKAVFNEIHLRFGASSFVFDVRSRGLVESQEQILLDLTKEKLKVESVDHGRNLMRNRLQSINSLVILDDVDDAEQLEALGRNWLGPGSRVIITTRDAHVLNVGRVDEIYKMQGLEYDRGLELFSWHAFLRGHPDEGYEDLSAEVVEACSGLPLSLEVVGSHLYDKKNTIYWQEALNHIQGGSLLDKVYKTLKISYDALNHEEQEIFKDIACFFLGRVKREIVIYFWQSSGWAVHTAIKNLQFRSLINVNEDDEFTMHDQLRDLGRNLVEEENGQNPGLCSRLLHPEIVPRVIHQGTGTKNIRGVVLPERENRINFQIESLALMSNLQLLNVNNANVEGEMAKLPPSLKWLKCIDCNLEKVRAQWNMEYLTVLDLSGSKIAQFWNETAPCKVSKNLKGLLLNDCSYLNRLPDLSNHASLVRVELRNFRTTAIPDSIWSLPQLAHLDLSMNLFERVQVWSLPQSVGQLQCLRYLNLNGRKGISSLTEEFAGLVLLEELLLNCFGELRSLVRLKASNCQKLVELPTLPEGLVEAHFSRCSKLRRLSTMPLTRKLKFLDLSNCCELSELPEVRTLGSLTELNLIGCQVNFRSLSLQELNSLQKVGLSMTISCSSLIQFFLPSCLALPLRFLSSSPTPLLLLLSSRSTTPFECPLWCLLTIVFNSPNYHQDCLRLRLLFSFGAHGNSRGFERHASIQEVGEGVASDREQSARTYKGTVGPSWRKRSRCKEWVKRGSVEEPPMRGVWQCLPLCMCGKWRMAPVLGGDASSGIRASGGFRIRDSGELIRGSGASSIKATLEREFVRRSGRSGSRAGSQGGS
eukprot:Gb_17461 [translate_table: standard]